MTSSPDARELSTRWSNGQRAPDGPAAVGANGEGDDLGRGPSVERHRCRETAHEQDKGDVESDGEPGMDVDAEGFFRPSASPAVVEPGASDETIGCPMMGKSAVA